MRASRAVVKYRVPILILALALLIPSFFGMVNTRINYDMLDYLPDDMDTVTGQNLLMEDFGKGAFSLIVVEDMPSADIRRTAEKLRLTWKGHDRSALSRLDAAGLVLNDCGKAPIRISQDGEARARDLLRQYGISCADASTTQMEEH